MANISAHDVRTRRTNEVMGEGWIACPFRCARQRWCAPVKINEITIRCFDAVTEKADAIRGCKQRAK
jgi:hypothetical protein